MQGKPHRAPTFVAAQLVGGLGNQLFQYAAGRALAERLKARLILDATPRYSAPRPIVLDQFAIDAEVVRDAWTEPHSVGNRRFEVFRERRPFAFDPAFEKLTRPTYLIGYWQS